LIVACVVGDGESETCPLDKEAGSRVNFVNPDPRPARCYPILHLNGYKISGPTAQGRTSDADLKAFMLAALQAYFVEAMIPKSSIQLLLEDC